MWLDPENRSHTFAVACEDLIAASVLHLQHFVTAIEEIQVSQSELSLPSLAFWLATSTLTPTVARHQFWFIVSFKVQILRGMTP
jgi:hypothetical protein